MKKIILATSNLGKVRELNSMLEGQYNVVSQIDMEVEEVPETGASFVENALIKARNASSQSKLPALADDSGLVVDSLNGEPGIYSARYAGENATDEDNIVKLLARMDDEDNRSARFWCAMVYVRYASDPEPVIVEKSWEGQILRELKGNNGFGYDPIFYLPELNCTSAQLSAEEKNRISHRGQALQEILKHLLSLE
jgi:XTP/dITP diphosphohydrolase